MGCSSNAVYLTDGLDGLAILPSVLIGGALGIIAYSKGNQFIADYLYLPHLPLSGELIVFCGALIGSGIYNTVPVFAGAIVGALALIGVYFGLNKITKIIPIGMFLEHQVFYYSH